MMQNGQVGALLVYGANPAYDHHDAEAFKAGLKKVKLSVSFTEKIDETSELCQYLVPNHHYLESWGDAEPKAGYTSFIQPTIYPLFKTRYFQTHYSNGACLPDRQVQLLITKLILKIIGQQNLAVKMHLMSLYKMV